MLTIAPTSSQYRSTAGERRQTSERSPGRLFKAVLGWIHRLWLDPRERFLAEAADHRELERRLRWWDEERGPHAIADWVQ